MLGDRVPLAEWLDLGLQPNDRAGVTPAPRRRRVMDPGGYGRPLVPGSAPRPAPSSPTPRAQRVAARVLALKEQWGDGRLSLSGRRNSASSPRTHIEAGPSDIQRASVPVGWDRVCLPCVLPSGKTGREWWFDVAVEAADVAEPPDAVGMRTGAPGRPSSMHLVVAELDRRGQAGELKPTLTEQAADLSTWLRRAHPSAAPLKPRSIANHIRRRFKDLTL